MPIISLQPPVVRIGVGWDVTEDGANGWMGLAARQPRPRAEVTGVGSEQTEG